jgi:hypothetical protein
MSYKGQNYEETADEADWAELRGLPTALPTKKLAQNRLWLWNTLEQHRCDTEILR